MTWKFDNKQPIYTQLVSGLRLRIITGVYKPGDKLPSVRDLAQEASVNPNTMQRALAELENLGLVYTQRTAGRYITEDEQLISDARREIAVRIISEFIQKMKALGLNEKEIRELMEEENHDR